MPRVHSVAQGECLSSIARKYGFANWRTVYDAPENATFRRKRQNPNLIYPGDELVIPDKIDGGVALPVGVLNTIVVQLTQSKLRIKLVDPLMAPLSKATYVLEVAGAKFSGIVQNGVIEHEVPPDATQGRLRVDLKPGDPNGIVEYTLRIGHLDPVGYVTGLQGRLRNLGFYAGPLSGQWDDATTSAWLDFKRRHRLGDSTDRDQQSLLALEQHHNPESKSSLTNDDNERKC